MGLVLRRLNDSRHIALRAEALAQLEPLPPGPELLEALANVAADSIFAGRALEGLGLADRALVIAAEADLARPARALGFRGFASCLLGDAGGLNDLRDALVLAVQAGRGQEAAILYNLLGVCVRNYDGPRSSLQTFQDALEFADARGLREMMIAIRSSALTSRLGMGDLQEALDAAVALGEYAEETGDELDLVEIRGVQAAALTYRGDASQAAGFLDEVAAGGQRSGRPDYITDVVSAAMAHAALGEIEAATALLEASEATPGLDEATEFALCLPAAVRTALAMGEPVLAERLAGHLTPRHLYAEHALVAVHAALAEARGDTETAAEVYADAAQRWESFGVVPEQGFALLGQGRCLLELKRPAESSEALGHAREIFAARGMRPALVETDALLVDATALSS